MDKTRHKKKNKAEAIASFIFGLLIWIPLLNWGFGFLAIFFGISALKKSFDKPDRYGGRAYAIIGSILGVMIIIFNIVYLLATLKVIDIPSISG